MKTRNIAVFALIASVLLYQTTLFAANMSLDNILKQITNPRLTSLQKLAVLEQYKGQTMSGYGKVKDILKGYGPDNIALVYVTRSCRDKEYEIELTVPLASAEKVLKGKKVSFEGIFGGMTFETLRFTDVKMTESKKAWWPF
ncbi:MAG: hypothetical protein JW994_08105 [Candidatus Omnitrophica bacterium]|nr:hypothetical protein [Candidatus Omnitrophota bacterium]